MRGYCFGPDLVPYSTHWHLIILPRRKGDVCRFMTTLTLSNATLACAPGTALGQPKKHNPMAEHAGHQTTGNEDIRQREPAE